MGVNKHTCMPDGVKSEICIGCLEDQTEFSSSHDRACSEWLKITPNCTPELLIAFSDGYYKGAEDWGDG